MDPRHQLREGLDERLVGTCVYCGGAPSTVDHVPSKVLLDDPFPQNLSTVDACEDCNNGFSADERYLACFIECVIAGSVDPAAMRRAKIARILGERPDLVAEIAGCRRSHESGTILWDPAPAKVLNVVMKLARGHMAYEGGEPRTDDPEDILITPLIAMSAERRREFETPPPVDAWPEIGSRAFLKALVVGDTPYFDDGWQVVQEGRYRYLFSTTGVRMVIGEYLACEVVW